MSITKLSTEIFLRITGFLSKKDIDSVNLSCKDLNGYLEETTWKKIALNDISLRVNEFPPTVYQALLYQYGYLTKELYLKTKGPDDNWSIQSLQYIFPNLQCLRLYGSCLPTCDNSTKLECTNWKYLVEFDCSVSSSCKNDPYTYEDLVKIFPFVHRIEKLRIYRTRNRVFHEHTLDFMQTIHDNFKRLKTLQTDLKLVPFETDDLQRITKVDPSDELTCFVLQANFLKMQWLGYFTRKYPNIRILEFKDVFYKAMKPENVPSQLVLEPIKFQGIEHPFSHLEQITISSAAISLKFTVTLWKSIERLDIPLKHIYHPALVDLQIENSILPIHLDVVLNFCPSLKKLRLVDSDISIGAETLEKPTMHGLQIVEIKGFFVSKSVFEYVSYNCRSLDYMNMKCPFLHRPISERSRIINIDMSFSNLKALYVCVKRLIPPNENHDGSKESDEDAHGDSNVPLTLAPHEKVQNNKSRTFIYATMSHQDKILKLDTSYLTQEEIEEFEYHLHSYTINDGLSHKGMDKLIDRVFIDRNTTYPLRYIHIRCRNIADFFLEDIDGLIGFGSSWDKLYKSI
ncbi:hypothetical protein PHYBLDRAFT_174036 [Phycomyces blakesleeanus NRRL 1555(-)]|uniref:F-box domain-containing protein n=1 Tax=Phycomyces blakesleeanus (strain ATCC 8743b / DSM 1359 / FGSC 10004 / NBRC 33097 / NRRL 1555) TaxID=763407 RepID=A0A162NBN4_PHYB8|nr:hypothetical protein PHYBLDRAFT_174036 [Phycomyces blakesleeanus NRRL 1555(-)]OAD67704.1 hypothetical protein PHYBLDRAFT_174036 [Phycomyces blakesleeanus NRRL 1555(-)]|eukprot:XP_018285744.1 hypothetical protein PHYBLDRAFT_174036 [Phycomyces blakesleeanus NRRL 1555(-)]